MSSLPQKGAVASAMELMQIDSSNPADRDYLNDGPSFDISGLFDGRVHGRCLGRKRKYPKRSAMRDAHLGSVRPSIFHRDILHRKSYKPVDLERGLDPFDGKLSHFVVQAASSVYDMDQGPWMRVKIKTNTSKRLRYAGWILIRSDLTHGGSPSTGELVLRILRVMFLAFPLPFMSLSPFEAVDSVRQSYMGVPARSWEYPKHVRNLLDASPQAQTHVTGSDAVSYHSNREQSRLLRPRLLVMKREGVWKVVEQDSNSKHEPYLFISYSKAHFNPEMGLSQYTKEHLESYSQAVTEMYNLSAYWLDYKCMAEVNPQLTDDIHRLADVTRGAQDVCIVLPSYDGTNMAQWGSRMWTLPEALLAPRHRVTVFSIAARERYELSLFELPRWAWLPYSNKATEQSLEEAQDVSLEDFRLLAEHFSGTLTLSRIELTTVALRALRSRKYKEFQQGDRAYALMAFLQYRPAMDPTDSEFQALARLSLKNDSDRIVERMICLLPQSHEEGLFTTEDALHAKLHEIEPIVQVAGVCHDDALIIDGARAINIHWDDFPSVKFVTRMTEKKKWSRRGLRFATLLWVLGFAFLAFLPVAGAIIIFLFALPLTFASPWLVAIVYGGKVWDMEPWLIGFEGTMPIEKTERMLFGNAIGRLSYAPSSSEFSRGQKWERIGAEPQEPSVLRPGHRMFTLVDTGSKTVMRISARLPPSAALICGKEGGMLRTLLCSYDHAARAYVKQTVVRMETPTLDRSGLMGWIKVK